MTIGTAIFLSCLMFSIVALFVATKDRWNWKKIAAFSGALLIGAPILIGSVWYAYAQYEQRPKPQSELWGIPLGATEGDVRFLKGDPTKVNENGTWVYSPQGDEHEVDGAHGIRFKDGQVWWVAYVVGSASYSPSLVGVNSDATYAEIIKALGEPSHTSVSEDEKSRAISYSQLNVFFALKKGKIELYGIFDPKKGAFQFRSEKSPQSKVGAK